MAASMRSCPRFAFLIRKALQSETSALKQQIRHASAPVARPAPEELDSKHNRTYVQVLEGKQSLQSQRANLIQDPVTVLNTL